MVHMAPRASTNDKHQLQKLCALLSNREKLWKRKLTLPFLECHDRRALVLQDGFVGMDPNQKLFTKSTGLKHRSCMACDVAMSIAEE